MADWGRGSGGSRGRVGTWDDAERRRRAFVWPDSLPGFGPAIEQLRNWAIADTGPGRLLPWLPVAFGLGIALYFAVDREPALRYAASIQGLRDSLDARIRAVLPGDRGSIASALITGKRDAISAPVNDAMYISSLAHVLSISG